MSQQPGRMPSSVDDELSWFDRFAGWASSVASRAWFFAACVLLIVVWGPSFFLFSSVDTWQLVINTATTIVTFLLVALLQNAQQRADQAVQHKLNAIAGGLAALCAAIITDSNLDLCAAMKLRADAAELRAAVGLEERESV